MKKILFLAAMIAAAAFVASCDIMHFEPDCPYGQELPADDNRDGEVDGGVTGEPKGEPKNDPVPEDPETSGNRTVTPSVTLPSVWVRGTYEEVLTGVSLNGNDLAVGRIQMSADPIKLIDLQEAAGTMTLNYTQDGKPRSITIYLGDYAKAFEEGGIVIDLYFREVKNL